MPLFSVSDEAVEDFESYIRSSGYTQCYNSSYYPSETCHNALINGEMRQFSTLDPGHRYCHHCSGFSGTFCDTHLVREGLNFCCESCFERYNSRPESLMPYYSENPNMDTASTQHPYRIGVEVEKCDSHWMENRPVTTAKRAGWICVSDGSLNDYGFELVSPCWNLKRLDHVIENIMSMEIIDAECDSSCGGHITVSKRGLTGEEFADEMSDFIPLLFAMYPKRLRCNWSAGQKKKQLYESCEKYIAIRTKPQSVEFRIFPRIKHREQLINRLKFVAWGMKVDERRTVASELEDPKSWIVKYLSQFYDEQRLKDKKEMYYAFLRWYEGEKVTRNQKAAIESHVHVPTSDVDLTTTLTC